MFFPLRYNTIPKKIAAFIGTVAIGILTVGVLHLSSVILLRGRVFHQLKDQKDASTFGKVHSLFKKHLQDSISETLPTFDNSSVRGQINGIYITTNESDVLATRQFLREHPRPSNEIRTIHIGCATWHNFDIICERRSDYGLIVDFNPKNAEFIKKTIDMVNASESREVFTKNMITYLHSLEGENKGVFFHADQQGTPTERVEKELLRDGSIVAITEDITNSENFFQLRKFLDREKVFIDTLYVSNICNFMRTDSKKESFVKTVSQMLNNDTIFISCPKLRRRDDSHATILHQRPVLGREVLASSFDKEAVFEKIEERD
jgi:hypothetical protein